VRLDSECVAKRFGKGSFDYVIDVENSLFYGSQDRFFMNVSQVLKDDGTFFFADCRPAGSFASFEKDIRKYFDIEVSEDITPRVINALSLDTPRMRKIIEDNFPSSKNTFISLIGFIVTVPFLKQGFVLKGTYLNRQFEKRNWLYKTYILKKKGYLE
jgi:hypothetical protein